MGSEPHQEETADLRFVLDAHLGKLAALLRLLGFDCLYRNDYEDTELAHIADAEERILLSRDRQLVEQRHVRRACLVLSDQPFEQAREVIGRYNLCSRARPWSRCLACNGIIEPVEKAAIAHLLQPRTKLYYERFSRCSRCGRIYWEGSHHRAMSTVLAELTRETERRRDP